jgi:threonine dehydrogenase-like Zn-dependent dehydrogenase
MIELLRNGKVVAYTARRQVAVMDWTPDQAPLRPDDVIGKTLVSLVSPGTEINYGFDVDRTEPGVGGYAAVYQVTAVGPEVTDIQPGDVVFCMGPHASWQRRARREVALVPKGLSPATAVFARLMAVTWATLSTTAARPADRVLVTGLGIIGNLAAQMFQSAGYRVTGVDPIEARRRLANESGISDTRASAADLADLTDSFSLAMECAGHERAALDCCQQVRKGGEVVLVGVPWKKRADLQAFDLCHAVFHKYVNLRSGWEWQMSSQPTDFRVGSIWGNFAAALQWLAEKRVRVNLLHKVFVPGDAQKVYDSLYRQDGEFLSGVFDWNGF